MNIIVAADEKWGIGNKGQLLVRIPSDQARFRELTLGKVVIMGRKTFESLPGQVGLYGRRNVVISSTPGYKAKMAEVVPSFEEADRYIQECLDAGYQTDDIFIIGGESIYRHYLSQCNRIYLTKLCYSYEADTFFPDITKEEGWTMTDESDEQTYFDLEYYYQIYERSILS